MELKTLKLLRIIVPGVLWYLLIVALCDTTQWCSLPIPQKWEEITKLSLAIVLGALYWLSPFREWSNGFYHLDVTSNIVRRLTEPFENEIAGIENLGWREIRTIFYPFIDNDESLKVQSSLIRQNGMFWTSIADLRVVSISGVLLFPASMLSSQYLSMYWPALRFDEYRAALPTFILAIVFLLTFYLSRIVTNRHKKLGDEQCEQLLVHYREQLRQQLESLCENQAR